MNTGGAKEVGLGGRCVDPIGLQDAMDRGVVDLLVFGIPGIKDFYGGIIHIKTGHELDAGEGFNFVVGEG